MKYWPEIMFVGGGLSIVVGVALLSVPASLIVGGVLLGGVSILAMRHPA